MNRSKDIGTKGETAVVKAIRPRGFPHGERRALAGTYDLGDIVGTPGVVWSVKAGHAAETASDAAISGWLDRAEDMRVNARADLAVLVVKRRGIGLENAHRWWAIVRTGDLVKAPLIDIPMRMLVDDVCRLLVAHGYGETTS